MARNNGQTTGKPTAGPGATVEQPRGPGANGQPGATPPVGGGNPFEADDAGAPPAGPPANEEETNEQAAARQGDDSRPYCPRHNCLCESTGSSKTKTFYRCPVPGCDTRERRARPQVKIPVSPMTCQRRGCASGGEKPYLQVNDDLSSVATLHMECPRCHNHVKVSRPQFAPQLARQRQAAAAEDFAER